MENAEQAPAEQPAGIGHNAPPEPLEAFDPKSLAEAPFLERLRARVLARHKAVFDRMKELTVAFATFPETFPSDEIQGQAADLFKMMRTVRSRADEFRKLETEPFRVIRGMIDEVFKTPSEDLEKLQKKLQGRIDKYAEEKKERERLDREAAAKRERDEAAARFRLAEEAERRRIDEQRRADEAARIEQQARETKERLEREAAAALRRKKRLDKIGPYLAIRSDREARRRELAEADRLRLAEESRKRHAEAVAAEQQKREDAKAQAKTARADETAARADRRDAEGEAKSAARETEVGLRVAVKQDARAERAEDHANASAADLSRTRGRFGTVASLSTNWTVKSVDYHAVDLNKLRGLITTDAIDAACWKFLQMHRNDEDGPKLAGVEFEQVESARMV